MSTAPLTAFFELTPHRLRHLEPEPEPERAPRTEVSAELLRRILHPQGREKPLRHLNIPHSKSTAKSPWRHYPVGHTLTLTRYGTPVAECTITGTRCMKVSTRLYLCAPTPAP